MATTVRLTEMPYETYFAPLDVLGYCLTRTGFLAPTWAELALPLKEVAHAPEAKLLDLVVSVLAGCRAIVQVNTRLRPAVALARVWGRERFAEQSTLARTLDAFSPTEVAQLRRGSEALFRRESGVLRHDFEHAWLRLDSALTSLPISKHAERSTKGKLEKKNRYGRQLARVHAPQYHETLFSRIYPGKQDSGPTYIPILEALDPALGLTPAQKQRTVVRSDAGFGSDAHVERALKADWQSWPKAKGVGVPRRTLDGSRLRRGNRWDKSAGWRRRRLRPPMCALRKPSCCVGRQRQVSSSTAASSVPFWSGAEPRSSPTMTTAGRVKPKSRPTKGG